MWSCFIFSRIPKRARNVADAVYIYKGTPWIKLFCLSALQHHHYYFFFFFLKIITDQGKQRAGEIERRKRMRRGRVSVFRD